MRIGIEAQRIFRKKKHGMDIVALELIRNLQKIGSAHEYFVFVKDDEDDAVLKESENVTIIKIPGGPYPYWEQVLLPREVKKHGIQLLHCTSNTAPLKIDIPLVVTVHDIIYMEQWNFTRGTYYQIFGNLYRRWNVPHVISKTSVIVTVSESERRTITEYFQLPPEKVKTIYNGVSEHFLRVTDEDELKRVRIKYNLPDNYIFFLGNTDPKKNVKGVLQAMSILRKKTRIPFTLLMLDIDQSYLEKTAEEIGDRQVLNSIAFAGYVPNEELPAVYSMATIFLYPSLRESFGIPILEAMACGTPVITSNSSSMPEVAGNAALLINPKDPSDIADGIMNLWNHTPLRSELAEKGLLRCKHFAWMQTASEVAGLYERILQHNDKSQPSDGFSMKKR